MYKFYTYILAIRIPVEMEIEKALHEKEEE